MQFNKPPGPEVESGVFWNKPQLVARLLYWHVRGMH